MQKDFPLFGALRCEDEDDDSEEGRADADGDGDEVVQHTIKAKEIANHQDRKFISLKGFTGYRHPSQIKLTYRIKFQI